MENLESNKEHKVGKIVESSEALLNDLKTLYDKMAASARKGDVDVFKFVEYCNEIKRLHDISVYLNKGVESLSLFKKSQKLTEKLHSVEFINTTKQNYEVKKDEEWDKFCLRIKDLFDNGILTEYKEKYVILDYYMISYVTKYCKDTFNFIIDEINEKESFPRFNEDGTIVEKAKVEKPKYYEEVKSLLFLRDINFPWFLQYAIKKLHNEVSENDEDSHNRIDFYYSNYENQIELMDTFYDEAVATFYKLYPEIKEYADANPEDFSGERHKTVKEKLEEQEEKFQESQKEAKEQFKLKISKISNVLDNDEKCI